MGRGRKANAKSVKALIAILRLDQVSRGEDLHFLPPFTSAMIRNTGVEKHLVFGSPLNIKSHAAYIGVHWNALCYVSDYFNSYLKGKGDDEVVHCS